MIRIKDKYKNTIPKIHPSDWRIHDYWESLNHDNMEGVSGMFYETITLCPKEERWKALVF